MIKFWTDFSIIEEEDIYGYMEIILVYPFLKQSLKNKHKDILKFWNVNIYRDIENYIPNSYVFVDDINDCDYIVLPFRYYMGDKKLNYFYNLSLSVNKKLICFYNCDETSDIIFDNIILFRTSYFKSKINDNVKVFPPFFGPKINEFQLCNNYKTIGFCGAITSDERKNVLDYIYKQDILSDYAKNFIIRNGFFCGTVDKKLGVFQFIENLKHNLYNVCVRGMGNFTYRFFETLSAGRIPIFIDTDTPLPFESIIDYKKHCIHIKYEDLELLPEAINEFESKNNLEQVQLNNYNLYNEFLSPKGFLENIFKEL